MLKHLSDTELKKMREMVTHLERELTREENERLFRRGGYWKQGNELRNDSENNGLQSGMSYGAKK